MHCDDAFQDLVLMGELEAVLEEKSLQRPLEPTVAQT